jgi:hypothetical protein
MARGPGLAAAALAFRHAAAHERVHQFHGLHGLDRGVARVVVHVAHAGHAIHFHAFLEQVLVDVDEARTRKDLVELVLLELVEVRRSARNSATSCHASSPARRSTISRSENDV